jgi:hypothetical protein
MNPILRNILVVAVGMAAGMIFITLGHQVSNIILPPPPSIDINDMNSLVANAKDLTAGHWALVLLSHALGPLCAGFIVGKFAVSPVKPIIWIVGMTYTLVGILNLYYMPTPIWMSIADLCMYIPMAWLGARMAGIK